MRRNESVVYCMYYTACPAISSKHMERKGLSYDGDAGTVRTDGAR
jgi:hypothetical protein